MWPCECFKTVKKMNGGAGVEFADQVGLAGTYVIMCTDLIKRKRNGLAKSKVSNSLEERAL